MNFYEELGIDPSERNDSFIMEKIRKKYRSLLLKLHPDRGTSSIDDSDRLIRVIAAYRYLCDPSQKKAYDQNLDANQSSEKYLFDFEKFEKFVLFLAGCIPLQTEWDEDIYVNIESTFVGDVIQLSVPTYRHHIDGNIVVFQQIEVCHTVRIISEVDYTEEYLTIEKSGNDVVSNEGTILRGDLYLNIV